MKATPYICLRPQLVELCSSPLDCNERSQEAEMFCLLNRDKVGTLALEIDKIVNKCEK